jgi:hypothetical protein
LFLIIFYLTLFYCSFFEFPDNAVASPFSPFPACKSFPAAAHTLDLNLKSCSNLPTPHHLLKPPSLSFLQQIPLITSAAFQTSTRKLLCLCLLCPHHHLKSSHPKPWQQLKAQFQFQAAAINSKPSPFPALAITNHKAVLIQTTAIPIQPIPKLPKPCTTHHTINLNPQFCPLPQLPANKFQNHAQPSQSSSPTNSSYHRAAARTEKKKEENLQ